MYNIINIYSLLEKGKRENVEDYIFPLANSATKNDKVFIVCDGVGGENKGEVASRIVSETIGYELTKISGTIKKEHLQDAILKSRDNFKEYIDLHPEAEKMSTTLTLAVVNNSEILVAWCGDSKIYHIRRDKILWKSKDHSLVQQLIETGNISETEAKKHPQRNIILRSISVTTKPESIDHKIITDLQDGDFILLASDGVFEQIDDVNLIQILNSNSVDKSKLFYEQCEGKTNDNYSMYLLEIINNIKIKKDKKMVPILSFIIFILVVITFGMIYKTNWQKQTTEQPILSDDSIKKSVAIPIPIFKPKNEIDTTSRLNSIEVPILTKNSKPDKRIDPSNIKKITDTAKKTQNKKPIILKKDSLIITKPTDSIKK